MAITKLMVNLIKKTAIILRLMLGYFIIRKPAMPLQFDIKGQLVSDKIKELLENERPVMIARFGSVELSCIIDYLNKPCFLNYIKYITHRITSFGYGKSTKFAMNNNAGFYPVTNQNLDRFSQLMLQCMPMVDVLGSWQSNEQLIKEKISNAQKVPLGDLEPYFHEHPWSEVLKGKKILVIHPFEESILEQYAKRKSLFKDQHVLPDFDLQIIRAIQSIANEPCGFANWFEALEYMKSEIDKKNFDIAIIGCGAYGFPLAAYVKSIGKKAVHLGGATQMLFGIKSKAWEDDPKFHYLMNEYWVNPKESERPVNYQLVEGGRYW